MNAAASRPSVLWISVAIAVVALVPYLQTLWHDFVNLDDTLYVTENARVQQGLTWNNVGWAFTTFEAANWHPVTWLSHMLDVELWGLRPGGHHVTNVLFHGANALLLFLLFLRMTSMVWPSALVALLFAAHPLRVESVAWISERKDVLSMFFGLLAIWSYVGYARSASVARYGLMVLWFALSLMSKPMLVTLPFALLLLDVWPLRRFASDQERSVSRLISEKIPLFILSILSCALTIMAQKSGGAVDVIEVPFADRVANAIVAYSTYMWKTIWPVELAVIYPHPGHWPVWQVGIGAVVLVGVSAVIVAMRRRVSGLLIGWLWLLGTLVPVIGLVQVGVQSMADRYTYVPSIGLGIMVAWSIDAIVAANRKALAATVVLVGLAVIALTARSFVQVGYWRDSLTLMSRTLEVTTENSLAHLNYGFAQRKAGHINEAIHHYQEALRINPKSALANENLGNVLAETGRAIDAIPYFDRALEVSRIPARTHNNFGTALRRAGENDRAEAEFREATRIDPEYALPHANLGDLLFMANRLDESVAEYRAALSLDPSLVEAHANLGAALAAQGNAVEAIRSFYAALAIRPDWLNVRVNLGAALASQGQFDEAIAQLQEVLRRKPDHAQARQLLDAAQAQKARQSGG